MYNIHGDIKRLPNAVTFIKTNLSNTNKINIFQNIQFLLEYDLIYIRKIYFSIFVFYSNLCIKRSFCESRFYKNYKSFLKGSNECLIASAYLTIQ